MAASRVAFRWLSLKRAGTVITARTIFPSFNLVSASLINFWRILAEISWGENFFPPSSTFSFVPILLLIEKMVGITPAWFLAASPTKYLMRADLLSPLISSNDTTEGVVRAPSAFSITLHSLPSITAIQELVVPRSIPTILLLTFMFSIYNYFKILE